MTPECRPPGPARSPAPFALRTKFEGPYRNFSIAKFQAQALLSDGPELLGAGPETPTMHIGERLKALMEDRRVSVKAMALHCGVTPGAVSNWFKTGRIKKENLLAAAELLQTTADQLIAGGAAPSVQAAQADLAQALETLARAVATQPRLQRRQVAALLPLLADEPDTRAETCEAILRVMEPEAAYQYTQTWEETAREVIAELGDSPLPPSQVLALVNEAHALGAKPKLVTKRRAA